MPEKFENDWTKLAERHKEALVLLTRWSDVSKTINQCSDPLCKRCINTRCLLKGTEEFLNKKGEVTTT